MARLWAAAGRVTRTLLLVLGARVLFDALLATIGRPATWVLAVVILLALEL